MVQRMMGGSMTNKPRYFWVYEGKRNCNSLRFVYTNPQTIKQVSPENWDEFYVIEAGPALEKIKRLESALKWCKLQRNDYITDVISWPTGNVSARKNEISKCDKELESILEGR